MIDITEIGPIILGCGALCYRYDEDEPCDAVGAIRTCFENGIVALDTAPLYGSSEELVGNALEQLKGEYNRDQYFITTKAGRLEMDHFDYSESSIRRSVDRSLERLKTSYIDLLLIHDVEFKTHEEVLEAMRTALQLKEDRIVRYIGFSAYPVKSLVETAKLCQREGIAVDAVLSYCNMTIQNTRLQSQVQEFHEAGVNVLINASPLAMALLRSSPPHDWHPASKELRDRSGEIGKKLKAREVEFADVAQQYSFRNWDGPVVVGCRTPQEVKTAIKNYADANSGNNKNSEIEQEVITAYGPLLNQTWPSGRFEGEEGN